MKQADVLIVGGGLVGLSLAIALAQAQVKVTVIERDALETKLQPSYDGRVSAISMGSERVLQAIGAWEHMREFAEPIRDIRVVDEDSTAHVHYHFSDISDEPMGNMVENRHLRAGLLIRARMQGTYLTLVSPAVIETIHRDAYRAEISLENGDSWRAPLLVAADGKRSRLRESAGIDVIETGYGQTAIVCTIEHTLAHEGLALERFLPAGPFAALPMQHNRSALVWTEPDDQASAMLALPEAQFHAEIAPRLGEFLGEFNVVGKRFSYPLQLILARRYIDRRLALIGDAAHAIHPIAGQGVNVGFRDVAVLAELVVDAMRLGLDIGGQGLLEHYQRWRRFDSMSMGAMTDFINRLFSTDRTPVRVARRAGLRAVNATPALKRYFMAHAMGLLGDLPKMMQP